MYMCFSGSDCVVAECIYTSEAATMIAVSDVTASAVVAADDGRIKYNKTQQHVSPARPAQIGSCSAVESRCIAC